MTQPTVRVFTKQGEDCGLKKIKMIRFDDLGPSMIAIDWMEDNFSTPAVFINSAGRTTFTNTHGNLTFEYP